MKRVWFALIFLILSALFCIGEQCFIKNFCSTLDVMSAHAEEYAKSGDALSLKRELDGMKEYWDKNNDILFTLSNHTVPDELAAKIRSCTADDENIESTVSDIRALNMIIYENRIRKLHK